MDKQDSTDLILQMSNLIKQLERIATDLEIGNKLLHEQNELLKGVLKRVEGYLHGD